MARYGHLSIVVQGPVWPAGRAPGGHATACVLASARRHFPAAQLVLSTWHGDPIEGLDFDTLVLANDPGALSRPGARVNNVNRLVVGTAAGLSAAEAPHCIKTRTDTPFHGDGLARRDLALASPGMPIRWRIHTGGRGTKNPLTTFLPYHPGDMVQFGATDDLRTLWSAPRAEWHDVFDGAASGDRGYRRFAEQHVLLACLRGAGIDAAIDAAHDIAPRVLSRSLDALLGMFDVFDEPETGIHLPPRITAIVPDWQVLSAAAFAGLRDYRAAEPAGDRALHATMLDNARVRLARDAPRLVPA